MTTSHRIRLAALLLAAVGAVSGSFADTTNDTATPPPPPPQRGPGHPGPRLDPERRLARLTEELGLTADQQAKIRQIFAAEAEALKQSEAAPLTGEERREKFRALRKEHREKIAALLTPEQQAKYAALRPKGPHGQPGGSAGAPPPPPEAAE